MIIETEQRKNIENDAAHWLATLDKDNLLDFENINLAFLSRRNSEFKLWLEQSDQNRVAFLQLSYVWRHQALENAFEPNVVKVKSKRSIFYAMAATVLVMVLPMLNLMQTGPEHSYETRLGSVKTVALDDGSKVELNSESKITASVSEKERVVTLTKGEAFFDIQHMDDKPFRVITGDKVITVLGTKFSVHKQDGSVKVVVTEGKVQVDNLIPTETSEIAILTAGDVAIADDKEIKVDTFTEEYVQLALSWRQGLIHFDGTTLKEAAKEFNRYNKVKIIFTDEDIADLKISGQFESDNYDAFLRLLSNGYGLKIQHSSTIDTIEVSS